MGPGAFHLLCLLALLLSVTCSASPAAAPPTPVNNQHVEAEQDVLGVRLVTHPACKADIHRLCAEDNTITLNDKTPNIDVIGCLLDQQVSS